VKRLDHAPPERPLELAVGAQPERLEPRETIPLRGAAGQFEEIRQGGRELAVGGQRHLVDIGLRARDRVMVETREVRSDRIDLAVGRSSAITRLT